MAELGFNLVTLNLQSDMLLTVQGSQAYANLHSHQLIDCVGV